jgi:hypothetical protein
MHSFHMYMMVNEERGEIDIFKNSKSKNGEIREKRLVKRKNDKIGCINLCFDFWDDVPFSCSNGHTETVGFGEI